ncbi:MAG: phosphoribosylanthranilate isomerase [Gammaproteobacteria bacterium]|nr:phosphoribosylanthranilate isomerase [Gammaproteobacteria bacterium]
MIFEDIQQMRFDCLRTRVKICGITDPDDAHAAVAAGADALGFVFHKPSARYLAPEHAAGIIRRLPAFVSAVGVVVDLEPAELDNIARTSGVGYFQFHGSEDPPACEAAGLPFLKALRVKPDTDIHSDAVRFSRARGFLLDAFVEDMPGGTGSMFDWSRIPASMPAPVFLAGGLTMDNVFDAVRTVRPYGVDVSSGVERSPGEKDRELIRTFMQSVRDADNQTRQARLEDS